jgi:hypothetical protein
MSLCFNQLSAYGFRRWLPILYALHDGDDVFPGHTIPQEDIEAEIYECETWLRQREMEMKQLSSELTIHARPRRA